VITVGETKPTFQWHADPAWELADQMHFADELRAGQIVAGGIDNFFQTSWPQMWQEAAQTWGHMPEEMREAVRAYGRWLNAVADSDTDEPTPERDAGSDDASPDADDSEASDDVDGM
jgi:hypothetical protein